MSYDFSLDNKAVASMAIGMVLLGLLIFFAGFLVGVAVRLESAAAGALAHTAPAPQFAGPVAAVAELRVTTLPPLPNAPPMGAGAAARAGETTAAAELVSVPPVPAGGETAADAASDLTAGEVLQAQEPPREQVSGGFAVQVGAFRDPVKATRLIDTLRKRGYRAQLFRLKDARRRLWHTVRLGPYNQGDEAARMAAHVIEQEQVQAFVRPPSAL